MSHCPNHKFTVGLPFSFRDLFLGLCITLPFNFAFLLSPVDHLQTFFFFLNTTLHSNSEML